MNQRLSQATFYQPDQQYESATNQQTLVIHS